MICDQIRLVMVILGRGGVLGQGKGNGAWVKKRLLGIGAWR